MSLSRRLNLAWKALRELGAEQVSQYAQYHMLLRLRVLERRTQPPKLPILGRDGSPLGSLHPLLALPQPEKIRIAIGNRGLSQIISEADEICSAKVRLFSDEPVPLRLEVPGELQHWSAYELGEPLPGAETDVKLIWEAGRFGWAVTLGRAFYLTGDERYPQAFWKYTESFMQANPAYLGPHWASAQEVALRLIALVFSAQLFAGSPHSTSERMQLLAQAVGVHAQRIPPTLSYARAQNNNHLLSEAAGLYTAGLALPLHPQAQNWQDLGWRWLQRGFERQIAPDGAYTQQSANYQRLMLQLALWVNSVAANASQSFPPASTQRLGAATRWLLALCERHNGRVPNLGPNDGAYILPLTICPFEDYRPVLQASAAAFLNERPFPAGAWDDMDLWFGRPETGAGDHKSGEQAAPTSIFLHSSRLTPHVLRLPQQDSWAYLRAAKFSNRPGHADQLHLDLWWRGANLAQDAGTYLYNSPAPWDNALARTAVHNTLTVDGADQMTHVGRFLWLDWAQAHVFAHNRAPDGTWERLSARQDGYRRFGLDHIRVVTAFHDGYWTVEDRVEGHLASQKTHTFTVRWLLPDWEWKIDKMEGMKVKIGIRSPHGWVALVISGKIIAASSPRLGVQIIRAGELIYGEGEVIPYLGWVSPTYGKKLPALSLSASVESIAPASIKSEWRLPK